MAIVNIGGVAIATGLVWTDRNAFSHAGQSVRRTLGGGLVVYTSSLSGGRPITLASLEDQGFVTHAQVQALQVLSENPEAVYNLTVGPDSFDVMFRHHEPPAFSATPLIERSVQEEADYYRVTIKLFTL